MVHDPTKNKLYYLKNQHTFHNLMIKSGFRQLHFSNGNIGNIRHRKAAKNYIPSCKKTGKKKRGNGFLFLFCV